MNSETRNEAEAGNLDGRSLKTGFLIVLTAALYLTAAHQTAWAIGFTVGSLLSLFSLFSLKAVIGILFRPGGMPFKSGFLLLGMFIKLPTYCFILDLALNSKGVSQAAVCIGITLMPVVITLKAVGQALLSLVPARTKTAAETTETQTAHTQITRAAKRRIAAQLARERG